MNAYLLFPDGKEKALTLSYDDCVDTDIELIKLMEKYNIKCTFNVNAGLFSPEGTVREEGQIHFRLSKQTARKLYDNPLCEVATHGYKHPVYHHISTAECVRDIIKDREELEETFGKIIRGHAYPYGAFNDDVVDILKQSGIVDARTTRSHRSFKLPEDWLRLDPTCHHCDSELMNLADKFINEDVANRDGWLFYLWGHTYEFRKDSNWNVIKEFFGKVANNDNVWYATNIEIYDYITAYRSLVYSVCGDKVYNPTATDVWVKFGDKSVCVPSGKTVNVC